MTIRRRHWPIFLKNYILTTIWLFLLRLSRNFRALRGRKFTSCVLTLQSPFHIIQAVLAPKGHAVHHISRRAK